MIKDATGNQPFEIRIYEYGLMVTDEFFPNDSDAARFALAQMHNRDQSRHGQYL